MKRVLLGFFLVCCVPTNAANPFLSKKMEEGETCDSKKFYQLVWAVLFEHVDVVDRFLADGAYAEVARRHQLPSGKTVLHLAVVPGDNSLEGHAKRMHIARALLSVGVPQDAVDIGGYTSINLLENYGEFAGKDEMRALLEEY